MRAFEGQETGSSRGRKDFGSQVSRFFVLVSRFEPAAEVRSLKLRHLPKTEPRDGGYRITVKARW